MPNLTIPECREQLLLVADMLQAVRPSEARMIRTIVTHMHRRSAVRMTRVKSPPVTSAMRAQIRRLASTTDMSQMEIGLRVGVNSGRVSETLAGKRK